MRDPEHRGHAVMCEEFPESVRDGDTGGRGL